MKSGITSNHRYALAQRIAMVRKSHAMNITAILGDDKTEGEVRTGSVATESMRLIIESLDH